MKTNIFIPEKINVGFQSRTDTYTQKLAYVIYFDQKGVLRKEASWNSWRDSKIDNIIHENIPTSGFVLNKKVGGHSSGWNHRQSYVRIYDSRDFEFEITVTNLLYILENTNSIKGKGLEGEFIYGWDGADILLIPTSSPDYVEISQFNKILHDKNYVKAKDLTTGATYKTKQNDEWIYLGRFDSYDGYDDKNQGKKYFFSNKNSSFVIVKALGDKIIGTISEECVDNYAELIDKLERNPSYSPYDKSKDKYLLFNFEEFAFKVSKNDSWRSSIFDSSHSVIKIRENGSVPNFYSLSIDERVSDTSYYSRNNYYTRDKVLYEGTLESIFNNYKPMYKNTYLVNGKLYQEGK